LVRLTCKVLQIKWLSFSNLPIGILNFEGGVEEVLQIHILCFCNWLLYFVTCVWRECSWRWRQYVSWNVGARKHAVTTRETI